MELSLSSFISCRNHGDYLNQAIESILDQTYKPDQLILIDDGSEDNTYEVMKEHESIAQIVKHEACMGNIASYNEGISLCTGRVIHLMAADDFINCKTAYEECMEYLNIDNVGFCSFGIKHVDSEGHPRGVTALPPFNGPVPSHIVLRHMSQMGNFVNGGGTLIKTELQKKIGPYDSDLPYSADWLNWIRALENCDHVAFVGKPYYAYRRHELSMTCQGRAPVEERQRCAEALFEALERTENAVRKRGQVSLEDNAGRKEDPPSV